MSIFARKKTGDFTTKHRFSHGGTQIMTDDLDGRNDISPVGFNLGVCIIRGQKQN
jgi:hypothetical protein